MPINRFFYHMKNSHGFGLVEALISIGVLAVGALGVMGLIQLQYLVSSQQNKMLVASNIRQSVVSAITHQDSWNQTKKNNPEMSCMNTYPSSCANGISADINIYDASGKLLVNTKDVTSGIDLNGRVCSGYSSLSSKCPLRLAIRWEVACNDAQSCKYPQELISFSFAGGETLGGILFDLGRYNFSKLSRIDLGDNQSPLLNCTKTNQIYIGQANSIVSNDGNTYVADANGCVPLAAFQGESGDPGDPGKDGRNGVVIIAAATPTPALTPTPAATATPVLTPTPILALTPTPTPTPANNKIVCKFDSNNFVKYGSACRGEGTSSGTYAVDIGAGRCMTVFGRMMCARNGYKMNGVKYNIYNQNVPKTLAPGVTTGGIRYRGKLTACGLGEQANVTLAAICYAEP